VWEPLCRRKVYNNVYRMLQWHMKPDHEYDWYHCLSMPCESICKRSLVLHLLRQKMVLETRIWRLALLTTNDCSKYYILILELERLIRVHGFSRRVTVIDIFLWWLRYETREVVPIDNIWFEMARLSFNKNSVLMTSAFRFWCLRQLPMLSIRRWL
jgi:hypothetical protein